MTQKTIQGHKNLLYLLYDTGLKKMFFKPGLDSEHVRTDSRSISRNLTLIY